MVEFHSLWQLLPGDDDRQSARALRHVLARRSDQDGQPREPQALRRGLARADLRVGDARHALGVSRSPRNGRGRSHDAGYRLVRRPFGGAQDRRHGGGLAPAGGAARLHRTGRALRLHASFAECARTPSFRRACAPIIGPGIATSSRRCRRSRTATSRCRQAPGSGLELVPDIDKKFTATIRVSALE